MPQSKVESSATPDISAGHDWRLGRFPELMQRRVDEILLVSSPYDAFILEEDGLLTELIFSEYTDLGLTHAPRVTRVATGQDALAALRSRRFDLVITMLRLGGMDVFALGRAAQELCPGLPVVLLIANELELHRLNQEPRPPGLDGVFVWQGDAKLFLAIIKHIEDRWNVEHDTEYGSVGVIILVEDSIAYRSVLLPIMYRELVRQTRAVMSEGLNRMQRQLRLRARPKILVAESYEDATRLFERYEEHVFGVIADVRFMRDNSHDAAAGIEYIRRVRMRKPDLPVLLQSSDAANRELAVGLRASFLHKQSTSLLLDVSEFMFRNFGFGDFVFRLPDGREAARAKDLRTMVDVLERVPAESVEYHARSNHFSNWLRARTEFVLARRLRPRKVSEFSDLEALRRYLITVFNDAIRINRRGVIEDFQVERFDPAASFARIGGGSLGGKARGLAFLDALLARHQLDRAFPDVRVFVPRSLVIGTSVFDEFLERNRLRTPTLVASSDQWLAHRFLASSLPDSLVASLRGFLENARYPLAVRSSGLLEDSQYYPFAGVFQSLMLPNAHPNIETRLRQLCDAIRLVYASCFYGEARAYLQATPHPIEAQKMAVIVQQVVGSAYGSRYYPSFAGVARSYNFYPFGHMKPEDGVACVALGLGRQVVEGNQGLRFCPTHPHVLPQLALGQQFLDQSQRMFYAVDLGRAALEFTSAADPAVVAYGLDEAEADGTLSAVGSVWSEEGEAFYDGIYRSGTRAITFAHVLKSDLFPLANILRSVLELGRRGFSAPVEIEFAGNCSPAPSEFAILQIRPYGTGNDFEPVEVDGLERACLLCYSEQALGNGVVHDVRDVIYVRPETFDASATPQIAEEIGRLNQRMHEEQRGYVVIGPGRWGTSNSWLGIPVAWGQVSGARMIIETTLANFVVDSSQGSHFFHNLTASGAAYVAVDPRAGQGFVDWDWLDAQPALDETRHLRHVRLGEPLELRIDGRTSRAAVLKRRAPRSA